jgi:hypothetical protein
VWLVWVQEAVSALGWGMTSSWDALRPGLRGLRILLRLCVWIVPFLLAVGLFVFLGAAKRWLGRAEDKAFSLSRWMEDRAGIQEADAWLKEVKRS